MKHGSSYEEFEASSTANQRLLREEELLVNVSVKIADAMELARIKKADLARRLGRSPSYVTQLLDGGRNLTLRTLADVADALDLTVQIDLPHQITILESVRLSATQCELPWEWKNLRVFSGTPKSTVVPAQSTEPERELAA